VAHVSRSSNGRAPSEPVGPVLQIVRRDDETTVVLGGDLDVYSVPAMRRALDDECDRRPRRMILDVGAVEFLDSTAVQAFVATHRHLEAHGCTLVLESPSASVQRLFEIVGLDSLLMAGQGGPR
jgi:anti-sigma B factor antagonist